jgi:DMSO/TMAO reductase YedYZ molybdopterin-dependent catalytic subunit
VGNAKWTGVRLKDLLAKAKVKAGAVDVSFDGLDAPIIPPTDKNPGTPDFVKSLAVAKANDPDVIVAYAMNDRELPMLNGFPLRLVVPGWFATYWVKALDEITVLDKPFDGFWVAKAYRVPKNDPRVNESPTDLAKETVPIAEMVTRSLFAFPLGGEKVAAGKAVEVNGLAWDGGKGIATVEVSADGGKTWNQAKLDPELGPYAWRRWRYPWTPAAGKHALMCRATSTSGETQVEKQWNRSGYARNVIERVEVEAG